MSVTVPKVVNAPKLPTSVEAGAVIGGYELVRRIGRGGMAEVWVARRALGRKGSKFVAIKLIADHHIGDERYCRMFKAEAELAAVLSHANIVQVFDEGEDDGRSFLIMEWVDGLNLLKLGAVLALLDDDDRRFRVASYIIGQLLYALKYAHSITSFDGNPLGIVHRDVSPQNVLVSNHGEVKLTDFGVAYYTMEESSGIHVKGKVRYMSPEQIQGKTRSATVDLFAVGALLHELLDGKKFRGEYEDGQEMFKAVMAGTIPPLTRPAPPELDDLRLRLLQPDPADRIQSAEEALDWLKRYPGYGDARDELTKLCSSLTGVVRPRVGPGRSSPKRAARPVRNLAKPRVNLRPAGPAAPPPPPPSGPGVRTNSTTAVKGTPATSQVPVISGGTECVQIPPPNSQPGSPAAAPRATAFGSSHPIAFATPAPAAAAVAPQPSSPIPLPVAAQASTPIPHPVAEQGSRPLAPSATAHAPTAQPFAGHGPLALPPAGTTAVPPTERLEQQDGSDPGSGAGATEMMIDPAMLIEIGPSSGTDQELAPYPAFPEGSDTSRDIRPRMPTHSQTTLGVRPKGIHIALLVVGLMMVALLSVGTTWVLFSKDHGDDARARPAPAPASTPEAETSKSPQETPSVDPAAPVPSAVEQDGESASASESQLEPDSQPQPQSQPSEERGSPAEGQDDDAAEVSRSQPPRDPPKRKPAAKKGRVTIKAFPGFEGAQIKIGSTLVSIPSKSRETSMKLPAGKYPLAWRRKGDKNWKQAGSVSLRSGRKTELLLTSTRGLIER